MEIFAVDPADTRACARRAMLWPGRMPAVTGGHPSVEVPGPGPRQATAETGWSLPLANCSAKNVTSPLSTE